MSLQTWKDEFYPVEAKEATQDDKTALLHSIKKWTGLLPENMKKHDVKYSESIKTDLIDNEPFAYFGVDAYSCALCCRHVLPKGSCDKCPLARHLGERCDNTDISPYQIYNATQNPEPMLQALLDTLKEFEEGNLFDTEE